MKLNLYLRNYRCNYNAPYGIIFLSLIFSIVALFLARFGSRDYDGYIKVFSCIPYDGCDVIWEVERTALIMAKVVQPFFGAEAVIFFYIIIGFLTKLFAFKKMDNFILVTFVYISLFSILFEVTQIRAAVGIGFAILSIQSYIFDNKLRALLYFIFSVSFHLSMAIIALLLVPCVPLFILFTFGIYFGSDISIIIEYILQNFDVSDGLRLYSFHAYLGSTELPSLFNAKNLFIIIFGLPIIFKWLPMKFRDVTSRAYICLFFSIISIYAISSDLFSRISDIYMVITTVFLTGYLKHHNKYKLLIVFISLLCLINSFKIIL